MTCGLKYSLLSVLFDWLWISNYFLIISYLAAECAPCCGVKSFIEVFCFFTEPADFGSWFDSKMAEVPILKGLNLYSNVERTVNSAL